MNAYTTRGHARIQPHEIAAVLRVNRPTAGGALVALERQRTAQAEAELERLLKQNCSTPKVAASRVSLIRRTISAALTCTGARLAGVCRRRAIPETAPTADTLGPATSQL